METNQREKQTLLVCSFFIFHARNRLPILSFLSGQKENFRIKLQPGHNMNR